MKPPSLIQWLRYLALAMPRNRVNAGFTLLELLAVFVILGILAGLGLPALINKGRLAKQSEAKIYLGTLNRAQEAYLLERGNFATNLPQLGIGLNSTRPHYSYSIPLAATNGVFMWADPFDDLTLKGYSSAVILTNGQLDSILCQTQQVNNRTPVASPTATGSILSCDGHMEPAQ